MQAGGALKPDPFYVDQVSWPIPLVRVNTYSMVRRIMYNERWATNVVDFQAMNTLDHLEEMGIPVVCEKWLTLPTNPEVVNVDLLYEGAVGAKRLDASVLSNVSTAVTQLPEKGEKGVACVTGEWADTV